MPDTAFISSSRELPFYDEADRNLLSMLPFRHFLAPSLKSLSEKAVTRRIIAEGE